MSPDQTARTNPSFLILAVIAYGLAASLLVQCNSSDDTKSGIRPSPTPSGAPFSSERPPLVPAGSAPPTPGGTPSFGDGDAQPPQSSGQKTETVRTPEVFPTPSPGTTGPRAPEPAGPSSSG